MEITETLYVADREAWRAWLQHHHTTTDEIWLLYPRRATGQVRIPYAEAVEEALCFGWIDGQQKTFDAGHAAQRFTPRRRASNWSSLNKERARLLCANGSMTLAGLAALGTVLEQPFSIPADIQAALQAQPPAWENFQRFDPIYQRLRIGYIEEMRKRPDEFARRLANFLRRTALNQTFGVLP